MGKYYQDKNGRVNITRIKNASTTTERSMAFVRFAEKPRRWIWPLSCVNDASEQKAVTAFSVRFGAAFSAA
jgi:hypothetical protein